MGEEIEKLPQKRGCVEEELGINRVNAEKDNEVSPDSLVINKEIFSSNISGNSNIGAEIINITEEHTKIINKEEKRKCKSNHAFSKFALEEKELILHDKYELGTRQCERKWGIDHTMFKSMKPPQLFENPLERKTWVHSQKERIKRSLGSIKENIIHILQTSPNTNYNNYSIDLHGLCDLCFDRGLAIIAASYNINLFELEVLLTFQFPTQWKQMTDKKWYCVQPTPKNNSNYSISPMHLVNLSVTGYVSLSEVRVNNLLMEIIATPLKNWYIFIFKQSLFRLIIINYFLISSLSITFELY